ncbi:MAG: 23S rRNA pseudouridine(2604) synthase RluF [Bacteroidia bacterium]|nr:23S rRNA pseudouridine(2604) synthase RluF [Bacteroidia bacterium]
MSDNDTSINLNKFISDTGICSRRGAEKYILEGRVKINGNPTQLGNRVRPGDVVTLDGKPLNAAPKLLYLAFHKPVGITCTTETHIPGNIISYINHPQRLFPIGRLDKDSEGLIFLTNDGNIVNKILRAGNNHQKEYIVTVNKPITPEFIKRMGNGVPILDTITQKCKVTQLGKFSFNIVLTQGLNRQIRRMCEYLGYEVQKLKRIRIMNIRLDDIKKGEWRYLNEKEMQEIQAMLVDSKKTA